MEILAKINVMTENSKGFEIPIFMADLATSRQNASKLSVVALACRNGQEVEHSAADHFFV